MFHCKITVNCWQLLPVTYCTIYRKVLLYSYTVTQCHAVFVLTGKLLYFLQLEKWCRIYTVNYCIICTVVITFTPQKIVYLQYKLQLSRLEFTLTKDDIVDCCLHTSKLTVTILLHVLNVLLHNILKPTITIGNQLLLNHYKFLNKPEIGNQLLLKH